ncbi:3-keto-5-aminohexanoate cleavage protein [Sporichthya polymorpha]|uniref:3-keto-5-aminohexanoate cleavage protein n=1 Tax=Sporichthya polymorpha TaxID=35751 RepID=UPI0003656365|nr:3-keto-5-aminohexanoate cleavage protein [Sporichthya polymorpha]
MALRDSGKVVVEVGVNEVATKDEAAGVPYTAEEVAADVVACGRAGVTMAHFHARHPDGRQAFTDAAITGDVLAAVAREIDLLAYPSYNNADLSVVWDLAASREPERRLQVSPFDPVQHIRRVLWQEESNSFGVVTFGPDDPAHSRPPYPPELDRLAELGLVPNIAIFNVSDLRWTLLAARAGVLRQPLNLKMFFSDRWVSNNEPDPAVLDFLLSRIPDGIDHETVVVPYAMSSAERCEALWDAALERGLGIRTGLGDTPLVHPTATNAELAERAVERVRKHGLEPATTAELRERCGLTAGAAA